MECGTLYSSGLHLSKNTFSGQFQKKKENLAAYRQTQIGSKSREIPDAHVDSDLSHIIPDARLSLVDSNLFLKLITVEEIEMAVKLANPNKAPRPDGFNSHFFTFFSKYAGQWWGEMAVKQ